MADFWQPQKNERKTELIKYWHQRAVLDRMNISISKELYTTMSRLFYSDAKKAKKCVVFFFFSVTLFISTRFLRNYCRYRLINTPLEPLRPADVPFWGFVDTAPHFGGEMPQKPNFGVVNRRFQAKWAKY